MPDLLNVATSGLLGMQKALATTGHNIANVDTEGYSRQVLTFESREPELGAGGFVGNGVRASTLERQYDAFLGKELRDNTSAANHFETFSLMAGRLADLLAQEDRGLATQVDRFFNSLQDVANNPQATPERQVLLGEAKALTEQFRQLDSSLESLNEQVNVRLDSMVQEINALSEGLALLNGKIDSARSQAGGQPPNDLLDKRDSMILKISEYVGVSVSEQSNGSLNVLIGTGQPLVVGTNFSALNLAPGQYDSLAYEIEFSQGTGSPSPITESISGGSMQGLLRFRDEALNGARQELGVLAAGITETFNAQQKLGLDLDGQPGVNFFKPIDPVVAPDFQNSGTSTASVTIVDIGQVQPTDYKLYYNGTQWQLTNERSGEVRTGQGPFNVDGLTIEVTAGANIGDSFLVRPGYRAASFMDVAITLPSNIAAAAPLKTSAAVANGGDAKITSIINSNVNDLPLTGDVTLTYSADALGAGQPGFTMTGGATGTIAYNPANESAGKKVDLGILGGATLELAGIPEAGDVLTISNNTNGAGDNRNALRMVELQTTASLLGNSASYQEVFASTVSSVGIQTRQAEASAETQITLQRQAEQALNALSGVNLDEEAANLLKFQQAYQATAQVVASANDMFNTLLSAFR
ncbi:MAG: flagellar hook-associated protein FlgK [Gammaproteobacteria bacterium]|nr:flagellar hook-associated protein FlgK [Gammaproteobacteria bacterium]